MDLILAAFLLATLPTDLQGMKMTTLKSQAKGDTQQKGSIQAFSAGLAPEPSVDTWILVFYSSVSDVDLQSLCESDFTNVPSSWTVDIPVDHSCVCKRQIFSAHGLITNCASEYDLFSIRDRLEGLVKMVEFLSPVSAYII